MKNKTNINCLVYVKGKQAVQKDAHPARSSTRRHEVVE